MHDEVPDYVGFIRVQTNFRANFKAATNEDCLEVSIKPVPVATRNTRNERNLSLRFAAMAFQCSRIRSSRLAVRSNWCQICNLRVSHVQAATAMAAHHAGGGTTCAQCQGSVRMTRRRMGHCFDVNTRDGARKSASY